MQINFREANPASRDLTGRLSRFVDWFLRPRGAPASIAPSAVRRIAIVKPCCLGDMLMATPAIRAIDRHFPNAEITVVTDRWTVPAVETNPRIEQLMLYPDRGGLPGAIQLASQLRQHRFDLAISLDRSPVIPLALWLARIPLRAGIDSHSRGIGLTYRAEPAPQQHESSLYLDTLREIGIHNEPEYPEFHVTDDAIVQVADLIPANSTRSIVVIHAGGAVNPGAQMLEKRWPATNYGELVTLLANESDAAVVLVGAESDRDAVETVRQFARSPVIDLCGRLTLVELAALCSKAALYVGNDSGVTHLASAVGTPVVAIFGPTNPNRYRPLGRRTRVCAPQESWTMNDITDLRSETRTDRPDISTVTMPTVFNACLELLGEQR